MHLDSTIQTSSDGSHTVISKMYDVPYHSRHGAISESEVVFIDAGLNYQHANELKLVKVFEMGFGTGLNVLLAYQWARKHNIKIDFQTIEAFPLDKEII